MFNKIIEITGSKQKNIDLIKEKVKITQTEKSEANNSLWHIAKNGYKIKKKIKKTFNFYRLKIY